MHASGRFTSQSLPPAEVCTALTPAVDLDRPALSWDAAVLAMAGDAMAEAQGALFDERFLERHAGEIIRDPEIAIVELVANAWDGAVSRTATRLQFGALRPIPRECQATRDFHSARAAERRVRYSWRLTRWRSWLK